MTVKFPYPILCFFLFYEKMCGMSGTVMDDQDEFWEVYGLNVIKIPFNKPCIRRSAEHIRVYKTSSVMYKGIQLMDRKLKKKDSPY